MATNQSADGVALQKAAEKLLLESTGTFSLSDESLEGIYVSTAMLRQNTAIIKAILTGTDASGRLQDDTVALDASRRPIVLLGDVGAGKTTFIRHLIHIDAKEMFDEAVVLHIDLGAEPRLMDELGTFIADEVQRRLRADHGLDIADRAFAEAVHLAEIVRFDRGLYGELKDLDPAGYERQRLRLLTRLMENREAHLRTVLEHIRSSWRKQTVIVLDNVDQRDYDFQERIFPVAAGLAAGWPATVFLALRPDFFYRSRREGTVAAYQPRALMITAPPVGAVLNKRLAFALHHLPDTVPRDGVPAAAGLLKDYLAMLLSTFESNEELPALIDRLAAGDVGRALKLVSRLLATVHMAEALDRYRREGHPAVTPEDLLRAITRAGTEGDGAGAVPVVNLCDVQADGEAS